LNFREAKPRFKANKRCSRFNPQANHELPNKESADKHPLFYISKKKHSKIRIKGSKILKVFINLEPEILLFVK
jgi:hypothetical protein